LSEMFDNISPVNLRPLTKQLGGRLDYGQPVSGKPLTREPDSSYDFTRWERCASETREPFRLSRCLAPCCQERLGDASHLLVSPCGVSLSCRGQT
jgi:hypothetical protein